MKKIKIQTTRTKLNLIELSDLVSIHHLHLLPETDKFNTLGIPTDLEETRTVLESWIAAHQLAEIKNYTFVIVDEISGAFMGLFGLKLSTPKYKSAEIWYKLDPKYWGKGYATEVLRKMIAYGFETLSLHRITAGCAIENIASIKVLEKVGMIKEGRRRQILPLQSGWSDNFEYAILATDIRK
ncbi:MAG: GNAT family N-acetyltransferase [Saprospiraceae bacterium]